MKNEFWMTTIEIDDVELDPVKVYYESSPPEPDVNWAGGLEILSVIYQDEDVMPKMSEKEIDALHDRLSDQLSWNAQDDGYGDWLYDCRRDDMLTGDR